MAILEAVDVEKRYGGVVALENASLVLAPGEVHVLIGSNGSGKSTLCKIVAGSVAPDRGVLRIDGTDVDIDGPRAAAALGVAVFYQELSLVETLSVEDNIYLGREPRRHGLVDRRRLREDTERMLALFEGVLGDGLTADASIASLAADQRQIVEILKVLASDGRILVFDEPTSSLDRRQVEVFYDRIRAEKSAGKAVVFISHRMREVFELGDRITVIRNGRTVATLAVGDTDENEIVRLMVGGEGPRPGAAAGVAVAPARAPATLVVEGLTGARLRDVSFTVHRGEILGLGGLHGQGQSELLRGLFGAAPVHAARLNLEGVALQIAGPAQAVRAGIAYVSGDRARDGALPGRSVFENLVGARLVRDRRSWVQRSDLMDHVRPVMERLETRLSGYAAPIGELSGGNQQKVIIGRWLAAEPCLLLLDDPTKGIDIGAKADLYAIMRELAASGVSIVLYSSEDAELLGNAHRVLVFNGGRIVRELEGESMTAYELYRAAYEAAA